MTEIQDGTRTTTRQDAGAVALGVWLVGGVFLDGWAHLNRTALETFFTPWHAVLYSGAAVSFAYLALLTRVAGGVPPGYGWALLGAPVFLVGGAADFGWHQLFGLEVGIDALLSPTHLVLLASGLAVLSAPWRASRGEEAVPAAAVVSLGLTTALSAFFLLYVSVFTNTLPSEALTRIPEGAPGHDEAELPAVAGLASYLLTTLLLAVPIIMLLRRRRVPVGSVTAVLMLVVTLSTLVADARQPWAPVAALVTGLVLDLVLVRTRDWPERRRVLAAATALPAILWPLQLIGLALSTGVRWPVELWSGIVMLCVAAAGLLAHLSAGQSGESAAGDATAGPVRPHVVEPVG